MIFPLFFLSSSTLSKTPLLVGYLFFAIACHQRREELQPFSLFFRSRFDILAHNGFVAHKLLLQQRYYLQNFLLESVLTEH